MIKEKKILISVTNRNITHYKSKGYNLKGDTMLLIDMKDMKPSSHVRITAVCELCSKETSLMYYKYMMNKERQGFYSCIHCSRLKAKITNNIRFGMDSYMQTDIGKEKYKQTCLDKYGVDNTFKDPEIQAKKMKTINDKFGGNSAMCSPETIKKSRITFLEKYGVDWISKSIHFRNIINDQTLERNNYKLPKLYNIHDFTYNKHTHIFNCKCINGKDHYFDIPLKYIYQRTNYNVCICTVCNPIKKYESWGEIETCDFISSIYNGLIQKTNKSILNGKHIDIYLPDINFGIEYNGIFWHSELYAQYDMIEYKTDLAKTKNVTLFHLWEDIWYNNKQFIKDTLNTYINKTYLDIENYTINKINNKLANTYENIFKSKLNKNCYSLTINNEIISIISITDNKIASYLYVNPRYDYNKCLNIFIKELNIKSIIINKNNCFINRTNFKLVKEFKQNYNYMCLAKRGVILYDRIKIYNEFKNHIDILENGYIKVYENKNELYDIKLNI